MTARPLHWSEIHDADCDCDGDLRDGEMVQILGKSCRKVRDRAEIDATLDAFRDACREQGQEQAKPPGACDLTRLSALLARSATLRDLLHEQINQIALDAVLDAAKVAL